MTYHSQDPRFLCDGFRSPGKVTALEAKGTIFDVSATDTNFMDTLCAELGVSRLTAELELSLFAVVGTLRTRCGAFVSG
jgi:hypothetical protein